MAYKRTGRPPGRPKTKWYSTIMTRVPEDLADQAKRYAAIHRQTVSDVLRDGLLLLLQEQDPYRPFMSDTNPVQEIMLDANSLSERESQEILSNTNRREDIMSDVNPLLDMGTREIMSDTNDVAAPVPDTHEDLPPFDTTRFALGTLCKNRHNYHGTGHSLRSQAGKKECLACQAARQRMRQRPPALVA